MLVAVVAIRGRNVRLRKAGVELCEDFLTSVHAELVRYVLTMMG